MACSILYKPWTFLYTACFTHRHTERRTQSQAFIRLYCVSACASSPFRFQSTRYLFTLSLSLCLAVPMYWCFPLCCGTFREKKPCAPCIWCAAAAAVTATIFELSSHTHTHTNSCLRFVTVAYAFNDSVEPIGTVHTRVCFVWNRMKSESGTFFHTNYLHTILQWIPF